MHAPIKGLKLSTHPRGDITQWFGENPALYARFGIDGHNGIDLVRPHGEHMYAIERAQVVDVKDTPEGYGKHVRIIATRKNKDGFYNEWTYGHCSAIHVAIGDIVDEGEHIANMGNTGFVVSGSTPFWKTNPFAGTHLHLGLRQVLKPVKGGWSYEGSDLRISTQNYDNGFKGSIDPRPILETLEDPDARIRQMLTIISLANTVIALLKLKLSKQ